ncbi:SepM family pheromone-processing serine protease [Bacillaceae bacterium W0354]
MRLNIKQIIALLVTLGVAIFLTNYKLDYYIYQPGSLYALDDVVEVDQRFESEGEMHLVTVRGGQATPLYYLWAKIRPYYEINDLNKIFPEGISEEEYRHAQLQYMESSQEKATVVAYQAANKDIKIDYIGVYIMAISENMPADGKLKVGDQILEINGSEVSSAEEAVAVTSDLEIGDSVIIKVIRDEKPVDVSLELAALPNDPNRPGMGVVLVTDRNVEVNPKVNFHSGSIGGPSAGLMMSLEIYDQLTAEDLTKGYQVAGTGEIDYEGNVHRIGGIDKKVVAAHKSGAHIFFAPHENGREDSNYNEAVKTAEELGTDMKIVPVNTFEDALNYLNELEPR